MPHRGDQRSKTTQLLEDDLFHNAVWNLKDEWGQSLCRIQEDVHSLVAVLLIRSYHQSSVRDAHHLIWFTIEGH